jgi:hypothetical protein
LLADGTSEIRFQVELDRGGGAVQRIPTEGSVRLPGAGDVEGLHDWTV